MKLKKFGCIRCGHIVEAPKKSKVVCTHCHRIMWDMSELKNDELIREEMIINFDEYLKCSE